MSVRQRTNMAENQAPQYPEAEQQRPAELRDGQMSPHGRGEDSHQHALHKEIPPKHHWGLPHKPELVLFYTLATLSWAAEIAAAVTGSGGHYPHYHHVHHHFHTWRWPFIACESAFLFFHFAAWLQTAVGMVQRASWVRDESDLNDRRQFLFLAVRLNRLMIVSQPFQEKDTLSSLHRAAHSHHSLCDVHCWVYPKA